MRHATLTVKKEVGERLGLDCFPCAGPYPNITGMKNLYWGKDALCVKCGVYVYKVDKSTYDRAY